MKQTSIEWFINSIESIEKSWVENIISTDEYFTNMEWIKSKAKEMHKVEHSKTWNTALDKYEVRAGNYMKAYEDFDDYYQKNYNKNI